MSKDPLELRVRSIIADVARRDITSLGADEDLVEKLNLDSLQGLHLLAAVEKRLGARFPDERLSELRTIRRLVEAIHKAGKGRAQ